MLKRNYKIIVYFLMLLFLNACGSSSNDSTPTTNNDFAFNTYTTTTVNYGKSLTIDGTTQTYAMDIYQPPSEDSRSARPLIIYAHGGFFVFGDKDEADSSNNGIGEFFAKSGYVLASINYRLIPDARTNLDFANRLHLPNSTQVTTASLSVIAAIDAMSDMRAAIRYFLADNDNANTYKIDVDNIFVAGYSAGAFTALNTGITNSTSNSQSNIVSSPTTHLSIPANFVSNYITARGTIEGDNDGNKTYTTINKIKGIVNIAGAVGDLDVIKAGIPPIYNISGDSDTTVPIGKGIIEESGYLVTYGSEEIFEKALTSGVLTKAHLLGGIGHNLWADCQSTKIYCNDIKKRIRSFLSDLVAQ
jgi:acetyl esterase/lipase